MSECCGKERNTNFCPNCGKPMDSKAGLRGLLNHVNSMLALADKKYAQTKAALELYNNTPSYNRSQKRSQQLDKEYQAAIKKQERVKGWQEALIKAIDGE